jgi:hypothetical protein
MSKIGKISSIKKVYPKGSYSLEASLSEKGYDRFPGTYSMMLPFKEMSGKHRTGLDPDAGYLNKLSDEAKLIEVKRINETRKRLEEATGLDLSPRSNYYDHSAKGKDGQNIPKVQTVKLYQGDNLFTFEDPIQEITFHWLSVHPQVASSYKAYERGEYVPQTQYYVNNEDIEQEQTYNKKVLVNKAIAELEEMAPEKKKKVARLLGLPVSDNTKESQVYNLLDTWIKQGDIKQGDYRGQNPIILFNKLINIDNKLLQVKDLVEQAINNSIYRMGKGGRVYEGAIELFKTKDELIEFLFSDKGQEDFLALEDKLVSKKTMVVQ